MSAREERQREALEAVAGLRRRGLGVAMGVGKTRIGLSDMAREKEAGARRFLVVAPKRVLFESWREEALKAGMAPLLEDVTFTTYRSLGKHPTEDFDAVYLDECHSLKYSHELWLRAYGGKVLGLTGTPPRYARGEKGRMVSAFCPIVYDYSTDQAVSDGILNDYRIILHPVTLSDGPTHRVKRRDGGSFLTSEQQHYAYWTQRVEQADTPAARKQTAIMRLQGLLAYASKEDYARQLLPLLRGEGDKVLVFANSTAQCDRLSPQAFHTRCKESRRHLEDFKAGRTDLLAAVAQLSEGVNIPGLRRGLILHAFANERRAGQRIGRFLRLSPEERCTVHLLYYRGTVDEEWVGQALSDFDAGKVFHSEPLF